MANWAPLRELLRMVDESVTFGWSELESLVGELPRSAYVHNAYWKGARSGWPGFTTRDVRVGEQVTFVRTGATPVAPPSSKQTTRRPTHRTTTADVILVGCVKSKLPHPAPARELYTSPLFRKARSYSERSGQPWFILSAQHGLVDPDAELGPYDLRLSTTPLTYRQEWGNRVVEDLHATLGTLADRTVEIHAGAAYADALRPRLTAAGATVVEPLAGLPLGPRLGWYDRLDPVRLAEHLLQSERALRPEEFLAMGPQRFKSPGLYSWWVDESGALELGRGLDHPVSTGLIYAGLAGATRKGGKKSSNTLWGRITTMHLGGRHDFSTFRFSLGSAIARARGEDQIDEGALTQWMHTHLRVVPVVVDDPDALEAIESTVLELLDPPLNLAKVPPTTLRVKLSALRRAYRHPVPQT